MEALAHAPEIPRAGRVLVQHAELEAVVGEDDERGVVVERVEIGAHDLVRVAVHLLHRAAVAAALLGERARELAPPEEVAEEVRGRVDALDVHELDVGAALLPELEADLAVALRRGERPLEVAEVVLRSRRGARDPRA